MTYVHYTATVAAIVIFASHLLSNSAFGQSGRSTMDLQREDAAAVFGPRLAALTVLRAQVVADYERYNVACSGKTMAIQPQAAPGIPLDRTLIGSGAVISLGSVTQYPWFPLKFEVKNETTPTCRILRHDMTTRSTLITDELSKIDEDARRRGTYPGVMRDLKAAYGFGMQG